MTVRSPVLQRALGSRPRLKPRALRGGTLLTIPAGILLSGALGTAAPAADATHVPPTAGTATSVPFQVAALHTRVTRNAHRPAPARHPRHVAHPRRVVHPRPTRPRPVTAHPVAAHPVTAHPVAPRPVPVTASAAAWDILGMVNNERAANGLPALRMNSALISSAHGHNLAMARFNTMSHQLPGEASLGNRVSAARYSWTMAGENVGWNSDRSTAGAEQLESVMYAELPPNDGHRLNILNSQFRDIGIDVLIDGATGKLWLTEDFGRP